MLEITIDKKEFIKRKDFNIRFKFFKWRSLLVGFFWDNGKFYICPFPTIIIEMYFEDVLICDCGYDMEKVAHDTGDGWLLEYSCTNNQSIICEPIEIKWPFEEVKTAGQLNNMGFKIV